MWKMRTKGQHDKATCQHPDTHTSPTAGLERIVCLSCGNVSVRYVEEFIIDDIKVDEAEVDESADELV